jgi:SAM-dependent methyltransferase
MTAFSLIRKVFRDEVPPRILIYGVLNKLNYILNTGNRRWEFERLYLEHGDFWNYHCSEYEQEKYRRTLCEARKVRPNAERVLELGCSVGAFTRLLSARFHKVVGVDLSAEVIRAARNFNRAKNIRFLRGSVPNVDLGSCFDIIFCAEILYYINKSYSMDVQRFLGSRLIKRNLLIRLILFASVPKTQEWENGWAQRLL